MAQLVEHILGKDEVPGPNPGSSSRQPQRFSSGALVFYMAFAPCKRGCLGLLLSLWSVLRTLCERKSVRISALVADILALAPIPG